MLVLCLNLVNSLFFVSFVGEGGHGIVTHVDHAKRTLRWSRV